MVTWESDAQFLTNDLNGASDVFATDLRTGFLFQLSWNFTLDRAPNGLTVGGGMSSDAASSRCRPPRRTSAGSIPTGASADVVLMDTDAPLATLYKRLHAGSVSKESVSVDGKVAFFGIGALAGFPGYTDAPVLWTGASCGRSTSGRPGAS